MAAMLPDGAFGDDGSHKCFMTQDYYDQHTFDDFDLVVVRPDWQPHKAAVNSSKKRKRGGGRKKKGCVGLGR